MLSSKEGELKSQKFLSGTDSFRQMVINLHTTYMMGKEMQKPAFPPICSKRGNYNKEKIYSFYKCKCMQALYLFTIVKSGKFSSNILERFLNGTVSFFPCAVATD